MNTLKIQIKPFYKSNSFHLKDDQIHILSTNKNEEKMIFLQIYIMRWYYMYYKKHLKIGGLP